MKLTEHAVHRRVATSAIIVALAVVGLYGLWHLPVDFLPSVTYPLIKVHIWWRGATPEEIDKNLADPIERQMAKVDNLDYLESSCIEGMYTLQANFKYGVPVEVAHQDALAAMARAGMIGFFGAAGLAIGALERAIDDIQAALVQRAPDIVAEKLMARTFLNNPTAK